VTGVINPSLPFKNHLTSVLGRTRAAVFLTFLLASFFSWGQVTSPKLIRPIEAALVSAPIGTFAEVEHISPDVLNARFRSHGFLVASHESIQGIATANGIANDRLLGIVFLSH
jgi:hypothetical protein